MCAFFSRRFGFTHKAMYLAYRCFYVERKQVLTDALTENIYNTLLKYNCWKIEYLSAIATKGKRNVGINKGYTLEGGDNMI